MLKRYGAILLLCAVASLPDAGAAEKFWNLERYWGGPRKPMVDIGYGQSVMQHKLFTGEFSDLRTVGVKLGYFRAKPKFPNVGELDDKFAFFDYSASDLFGSSSAVSSVNSELIRFGFGRREGYAYDFKSSYLYPYTQTAFSLTKLSTTRPASLSPGDAAILDRFQGDFRFGSMAEIGMAYGIGDVVSVRAGYENWVMNPRWVFWPWLGSYLIGSIGTELVSSFGDDIVEGSPTLGPMIYTILRGAVIYGFAVLLRDAQYWPFRSEKPLTGEGFRVGMTFTF
jgi:hypothetical protein